MKLALLYDSGFKEGSFPFTYLGVPLSPHRLLVSQFSPLLFKLDSAVQNWMGKNLLYAGRLELLKTVIYGMVQFWINVFPLPATVINQIISTCRNFLWTSNTTKSTFALVAWNRVCLPKKEGGLSLFDVKARNKSFLTRHLWNIHLKKDSIWIQWVHHYYLLTYSIWTVCAHMSFYLLWKFIIYLKDQQVKSCGHSFETRPGQVIGSRVRWIDSGQPKKKPIKKTHN